VIILSGNMFMYKKSLIKTFDTLIISQIGTYRVDSKIDKKDISEN